jgi:hypothetical protein
MGEALDKLNPDRAQELYDQGTTILRVPLFAFIDGVGDKINPDDPRLASVSQAQQARKILNSYDEELAKIDGVRKRVKAEDELMKIMNKLNDLTKLKTDEELDALEALITGYRENPLDPELGDSNPVNKEKYSTLIARLTGKEQDIIQERKHRLEGRTTAIQGQVNSKVSNLLRQQRYQAALDHIKAESKKWPEAQLEGEHDRVNTTAKEKWDVASKNADGKYKDGISATNNTANRKKALKAAIAGMTTVIERYGIDEYVREAKELKSKYERALRNLDS